MIDKKDPLLLIAERCAVTAFGMELRLYKDGRERGLWFYLDDDSDFLRQTVNKWFDDALSHIIEVTGVPKERILSTALTLRNAASTILQDKVHEAAMIEWQELETIYRLIGKQLAYARKKKLLKKRRRRVVKPKE